MLNRIAFDSAVGSGGVLARLRLVGELARVKTDLKGADSALARLKLSARANQIHVELGAGIGVFGATTEIVRTADVGAAIALVDAEVAKRGAGDDQVLDSADASPVSLEQAKAYWDANFGGKTIAVTVHGKTSRIPIKVWFDPENDHAYTSGKFPRVFDAKRALAMQRILSVIEYPQKRTRANGGAVWLAERRVNGEHFTVVLAWRKSALYEFKSSHFKPIDEVERMMLHQPQKGEGPL